jgi:alpha-L-fucosidase
VFPDGSLTVKDLQLPASADITLLGREGTLKWQQHGQDIKITMPRLNPSKMPCRFAWTFKIER